MNGQARRRAPEAEEVRAPLRRARAAYHPSIVRRVFRAARGARRSRPRERTVVPGVGATLARTNTRGITATQTGARLLTARVSSRRRSRERCTRSRWTSPRPPTWCCWSVRSPCPWCSPMPSAAARGPRRPSTKKIVAGRRNRRDKRRSSVWSGARNAVPRRWRSRLSEASPRRERPRISGRASRCSRKGRERTRNPRPTDPNRLRRTRSSAAAANERRRDRSEPSPRASTTSTSGTSSTPRAWITPCSSAPRSRSRRRRHPRVRFRNRR